MRTVFLLLNTEYVERWIRSITPDLSDNVKKKTFVSHLFGSTVFAVFYLNTAWRRIAADIKVKVKHARRLQAYLKPKENTENSNKISTSF